MNWEALERAAFEARSQAYCPYSGYSVGAAILDEQDRIHVGCNVENVSYAATLCAERVALGNMVSAGGRVVKGILVATADGGTPCGICLQSLLEFRPPSGSTEVTVVGGGERRFFTLQELMPQPFASFLPTSDKE